jgi:predicted transposase YdaD
VQFQSDAEIYFCLFSEISLCLPQYQPQNPWREVVIYPSRSLYTVDNKDYSEFLPVSVSAEFI